MKHSKFLLALVAVCMVLCLVLGLVACGNNPDDNNTPDNNNPQETTTTAPTDLKINGVTGEYSFTAVKGVSRYYYDIYKAKEFDKETKLPGFESVEKKDEDGMKVVDDEGNAVYEDVQFESVYDGNVTKNSGTINYIANIPFGKYVILFSDAADETKATMSWYAEFTHPGKLSVPTFGVYAGAGGGFGGFGGGDKPAGDGPSAPSGDGPSAPSCDGPSAPSGDAPSAPSGDGPSAPSGDAPSAPSGDAPSAPSGDAPSGDAPSGNGPGGGFGGGSSSGSKDLSGYKLQVYINTDEYLKNAFKNEGVYGYKVEVYVLKDGVTLAEGATPTMDQLVKIDEGHINGADIQEANFTLYSGNGVNWTELHINGASSDAVNLGDYFTENADARVTVYVRAQAEGNADDGASESDWSDVTAFTMTASSSIGFDAGFGRPGGGSRIPGME